MSLTAKTRNRLYTVFFMFTITLVFVSALSAVQITTRDLVARNERLFEQKAVREAAGLPPLPPDALRLWYSNSVRVAGKAPDKIRYAVADDSGTPCAVVYFRTGAGLWGEITAAIGLSVPLGRELRGITFTVQNETPGLGARITEAWFTAQFRGKTGPFTTVPEGTGSAAPDKFDAITGATITSHAVRDMLNGLIRDRSAVSTPGDG